MLRNWTSCTLLRSISLQQTRFKRKIIRSDPSKQHTVRIVYSPRTEATPRKHLIQQQREEEERSKLQALIDEFYKYTEPKFEMTLIEQLLRLRDNTPKLTEHEYAQSKPIFQRDVKHVKNLLEWLQKHDISPSNNQDSVTTYLQAVLHVTFTQHQYLANNDRLQPLGGALLRTAVRSAITKIMESRNDGRWSTLREIQQVEDSITSRQALYDACDKLNLKNLVLYDTALAKTLDQLPAMACASALQAMIAAIYIDSGAEHCYAFIHKHLFPIVMQNMLSQVKEVEPIIEERSSTQQQKASHKNTSTTEQQQSKANNNNNNALIEQKPVVNGIIDYPILLRDMIRDKFRGTVHYRSIKGNMVLARRFRVWNKKKAKKKKDALVIDENDSDIIVALYINNKVMGITKGDSFTQAKHAIAKQVYQDLISSKLRQEKLKFSTVNINYVYSIRRIVGLK
jgi:dsRNA-specific ribonuclease